MAHLCKRKNRQNYYVVVWLPHQNRKKYISTGTQNLKEAQKILRQIQTAENLQKAGSKAFDTLHQENLLELNLIKNVDEIMEIDNQLTLKTAAERFLKSRVNEISSGTSKSYALALKDLQAALNPGTQVKSLKRGDYDTLVAFLVAHYNVSTTNIRLRGIRTFIHWLMEFELIEKRPFKIKQLKNEKLPKFLTPEEITGIFKHVSDPVIRSAFRVYQYTGIRLSELYSSELEGSFLKVRGKGNKSRFVPLPQEVRDDFLIAVAGGYSHHTITHHFTDCWRKSLLERHQDKLPETGLQGLTKKRIRELVFQILEEQHAKVLNKTELTMAEKREAHSNAKSLHSFRHTFAVRTWLKTSDIYAVKKLLGHTTVSVTEIYMKFPEAYLKQIFKQKSS
ncbi:tyrosine-type recombinase/integrase [candidate division KSB1 bacterium]|nr:tyrosine-type recombinase/integrase [candidate division KSB1 bacterium]